MSILRTRHGTLEIRRTEHGPVVVMNGEHFFSVEDLLIELLDIYYQRGEWHPRGSTGWLEELTGLTFDNSCPLCRGPGEMTRCPQCSIGRCVTCAVLHDGSALCQETRRYADVHRQMRGATEQDESDFYFARRSMASTHVRRRLQ